MGAQLVSLDLGGTQIRTARLDEHLNLLQRYDTLTLAEQGLDTTIDRIKAAIMQVLPQDGAPIAGIGVSAPGALNPQTGVLVAPPNLRGWHNVPIGDILREAFGVPVYCGNDANVAALAEVARGAARGFRHVIYITVSTGIGSGIIYDGRLLLGREGLAAEAGHMPLVVDGGRVSTLEKEAAGPALARRARSRLEAGESSALREMAGGDLSRIDARMIGQAAHAGDALAREIVAYGGFCVGLGIVSLLHIFNPDVVVIGGGVSNIGDLLFTPMWETVKRYTLDEAYWRDLRIERAQLGGDVSIVGAGALVLTHGGQADVTQVIHILND